MPSKHVKLVKSLLIRPIERSIDYPHLIGSNGEQICNSSKFKWLSSKGRHKAHTTPAAPAVMAIGAVTALSPDEHITGILTAREIEYAAASVGAAYINQHKKIIHISTSTINFFRYIFSCYVILIYCLETATVILCKYVLYGRCICLFSQLIATWYVNSR